MFFVKGFTVYCNRVFSDSVHLGYFGVECNQLLGVAVFQRIMPSDSFPNPNATVCRNLFRHFVKLCLCIFPAGYEVNVSAFKLSEIAIVILRQVIERFRHRLEVVQRCPMPVAATGFDFFAVAVNHPSDGWRELLRRECRHLLRYGNPLPDSFLGVAFPDSLCPRKPLLPGSAEGYIFAVLDLVLGLLRTLVSLRDDGAARFLRVWAAPSKHFLHFADR